MDERKLRSRVGNAAAILAIPALNAVETDADAELFDAVGQDRQISVISTHKALQWILGVVWRRATIRDGPAIDWWSTGCHAPLRIVV